MIGKRAPANSRKSAAARKYFDSVNDGRKRAELKIREAGAFASQFVEVWGQHGMSADKSEMVVAKCIRTNDDDIHACCARPCSQRIRFSRRVSSNLEVLSRNRSRDKGGWFK